MCAELVGSSRSSLTRKAPLFFTGPPTRDDGYGASSLRKEIASRQPNAVNRIRRNPPPRHEVTLIEISDSVMAVASESDRHQLGTGRPRELISPICVNPI